MTFIARVVATVLLPVLLIGCNKDPAPPLIFGAKAGPGSGPVYLARELGYFSAVNLRFAQYGNASEVKQAFLKHELSLAAVTLDDALQLRRDIPDLKILFLLDTSKGADVTLGQPGITDMKLEVLIARDDDVGRYHHEMVEWLRGWHRALEYLRNQPDKAMEIMASLEHIDATQFGKAMQGIELLGLQRNRELLLGDLPAVGHSVESAQRLLLEKGLINVGADTATLLDTSLLAGVTK